MTTTNNRISKFILLIGFFLIPFMMGSLKIFGYAGLVLILIGIFINMRSISISHITICSLLSILLIGIRVIIQTISNNIYDSTIRSAVLQILTYAFIIGVCNCKIRLDDWKTILDRSAIFYLLIAVYLFIRNQLDYSDLFGTMYGNVLIVTFGVFLVNVFMDKKKLINIIECVITLIFLFFTNMRSAFVGALVGVIYVFLPKRIIENKKFNKTVFIVLVFICLLVPYIYMELYRPSTSLTTTISNFLQLSTRQLTGSRFFSGRHVIWPNVLEVISETPIFGKGIGFNPSEIYDTSQSTHNLFLFIRLEQGVVGLFVFVMLIKSVWENYNNLLSGSKKISIQAIFIALMIQQTFSLGLLGGKGAFSFFSWAVLIAYTKVNANMHENKLLSLREEQ